jgi:hypothetical protein
MFDRGHVNLPGHFPTAAGVPEDPGQANRAILHSTRYGQPAPVASALADHKGRFLLMTPEGGSDHLMMNIYRSA